MPYTSKTIELGEYYNERVDAPAGGIYLGYSRFPQGLLIETLCTADFTLAPDTAIYIQRGGSEGARVVYWEGAEAVYQSGPTAIRYSIRRTALGVAVPILIFAANDSGERFPFTMRLTCFSITNR